MERAISTPGELIHASEIPRWTSPGINLLLGPSTHPRGSPVVWLYMNLQHDAVPTSRKVASDYCPDRADVRRPCITYIAISSSTTRSLRSHHLEQSISPV